MQDISEYTTFEEFKLCKHLESYYLNTFFAKHTKNFFSLRKEISTHKIEIPTLKSIYGHYFINNLSLDWKAIGNPGRQEFQNINKEGCIFTIQFDDKAQYLIASNHEHIIEVWDFETKKRIKCLRDHKEIVTSLEFFKNDSSMMMSSSLDKTLKLWKDFECVHTYLEHNDWIRCLGISNTNKYFLSGCVSSVIKKWDLGTNKVINTITNPTSDNTFLNTVNSLSFQNASDDLFLCGFRDGCVKIFDSRANDEIMVNFKAHNMKLNSVKFSRSDMYLLSSGRDSRARLWDMRNLPKSDNIDECLKFCTNEYKGHKCVGYNIESNFLNGESYVITGSEDSHIYIYDVNNSKLVKKYKTDQKCVNLVKPVPNINNSFAFSGLENTYIYLWNNSKVFAREVQRNYKVKTNSQEQNSDDEKKDNQNDNKGDEDSTQELQMKLIEDIMSECGDLILRVFHSNNLTYSSGMNFENLFEIIQKKNDPESMKVIQLINEKFMKRICETFIESRVNKTKVKTETKEKKSKVFTKQFISCLKCTKANIKSKRLSELNQDLKELITNLPNKSNGFENYVNEKTEETQNSMRQLKLLYNTDEITKKYNYLLEKFI